MLTNKKTTIGESLKMRAAECLKESRKAKYLGYHNVAKLYRQRFWNYTVTANGMASEMENEIKADARIRLALGFWEKNRDDSDIAYAEALLTAQDFKDKGGTENDIKTIRKCAIAILNATEDMPESSMFGSAIYKEDVDEAAQKATQLLYLLEEMQAKIES